MLERRKNIRAATSGNLQYSAPAAGPGIVCKIKPAPGVETSRQEFLFLSFKQLCACVPLSERTLREEIKRGRIPRIRLPGARRLLFDPEAVRAALLRYQRGGAA